MKRPKQSRKGNQMAVAKGLGCMEGRREQARRSWGREEDGTECDPERIIK